jgi:hypothetical protein
MTSMIMIAAALFILLTALPVGSLASLVGAGASILTAIAILASAYVTLRGQRQSKAAVDVVYKAVSDTHGAVAEVASQVETSNGLTVAALAERREGRRISVDIPIDQRTTSEQEYVDNLEDGGRNVGHTEPTDRTIVTGERAPSTQAERDIRPNVSGT